tara:strand:- start:11 stop:607 length:597 start_codon:yes stop_codon:yes gene_type:complete
MGNVGSVGNWDLTGQECRVRHGENHANGVKDVFVDVLCNACVDKQCNDGGECMDPTTWESPWDYSCGTDSDGYALSCYGSFGGPIEKWCREALNATVCDEFGDCTYDESNCVFDGKKNEHFYYGTCRADDFVIGEGWIVLFIVLGIILLLYLGTYACYRYSGAYKEMSFTFYRNRLAPIPLPYRQRRADFNMVRSDSV